MPTPKVVTVALAALCAMSLAACGTTPPPAGSASPTASVTPKETKELTVVTHDSFNVNKDLLAAFAKETGYDVKFVSPGDGGTVVNQLVLTKDAPLGDVVFGIDNTFAGRAISQGVLSPYRATSLPAADAAPLSADDSGSLTPIDYGDVCVNADKAWFAAKNLALPVTLDDLAKPEYKNLLVVQNPASSTPGLAFLTATVGAKGEGWLDYWAGLKANGVKVVKGWTEAYSVEFSAGEGKGTRPLVVSYSTSPAFTTNSAKTETTTTALLGTCFRQVEYAGVIKGAKNEVGARKFIEFLLSPMVQADIPGEMYMYPAVKATPLPADWVKFAPLAHKPFAVPASDIATKREAWIKDWTAKVVG